MSDPAAPPAADAAKTFTLEDVEALVAEKLNAALSAIPGTINAAITGHLKRLDIEGKIAKALPAQPEPKPADPAAAAQPSPELALMRAKLAELETREKEATAKFTAREREVAREAARTALRDQLIAKGVSAARARMAVNDLEATKALRFDEEGRAQLVVKRARSKGARPEELVYEDFAEGVADWAQTPDAAEVLPAPTPAAPAGARPGAVRTPAGSRPALPATAPDTEEAAAALAASLLGS